MLLVEVRQVPVHAKSTQQDCAPILEWTRLFHKGQRSSHEHGEAAEGPNVEGSLFIPLELVVQVLLVLSCQPGAVVESFKLF
jgi:hypothetical protein